MAFLFLLFVHFFLKDHFHFFAAVFYAAPLPILGLAGSAVTLFYFLRPRKLFLPLLLATLAIWSYWVYSCYGSSPGPIPPDAETVIFWNAGDGPQIPREIISENIRNHQPDIIALVETMNAQPEDVDYLTELFPDYEFKILEGFMMIGVKGKVIEVEYVQEKFSHEINFIQLELPSGPIQLALTDTWQKPTMDKQALLAKILDLLQSRGAELVVGDFNTPYESVHFKTFGQDYQSFHDVSVGFTATWPFGVPLLEIDQIFVNRQFKPLSLEKFYYMVSDHGLLVGKFLRHAH